MMKEYNKYISSTNFAFCLLLKYLRDYDVPDEPFKLHVHPIPLLIVAPELHLHPVQDVMPQLSPLCPAPVAGKVEHHPVSPLLVVIVYPCVDVLKSDHSRLIRCLCGATA